MLRRNIKNKNEWTKNRRIEKKVKKKLYIYVYNKENKQEEHKRNKYKKKMDT